MDFGVVLQLVVVILLHIQLFEPAVSFKRQLKAFKGLVNIREWKILILALTFAPFFIYLMYAYFGATAPSYKLLVLNHDRTDFAVDVVETPGARGLIAEWERVMRPDGKPVFKVTEVEDVASYLARMKPASWRRAMCRAVRELLEAASRTAQAE